MRNDASVRHVGTIWKTYKNKTNNFQVIMFLVIILSRKHAKKCKQHFINFMQLNQTTSKLYLTKMLFLKKKKKISLQLSQSRSTKFNLVNT